MFRKIVNSSLSAIGSPSKESAGEGRFADGFVKVDLRPASRVVKNLSTNEAVIEGNA